MNRAFFLDLDGTLLDSRNRIHRLFCELAASTQLGFEEYWKLKREGAGQKALLTGRLGFSEGAAERFMKRWLEAIEEDARLLEDSPYPGALDLLQKLADAGEVYIVTGRQDPDKAERQAERFGWLPFLKGLLVTRRQMSKEELIRSWAVPAAAGAIAGDSGEEILAGKALGIRTVAVSYGFNSSERLRAYGPDALVDRPGDIAPAMGA
ncbi:MAG TPA: HAD family hydrolase [Thermoanaerobaculia bacterium]|nr:HAD family hydrolase [Thermoanaerobaculia bacterium]